MLNSKMDIINYSNAVYLMHAVSEVSRLDNI